MNSRYGFFVIVALLGLLLPAGAYGRGVVRDSVLHIPAGVKSVTDREFADRADFHTVVFDTPSSVTSIGEYAFLGCTGLRSIVLPKTLRKLGEGAFRECRELREITIPAGVTAIPRQTFAWCTALEKVALPASVTDLASHAFVYCSSLRKMDFPPRLGHIGSNTFAFCTSLTEVRLPATVTELESYAFAECYSLRSAVLPANRKMLGELIFNGCRSLETVTELSAVPPTFDCDSSLFDVSDGMYDTCTLIVPASAIAAYREAPEWSRFAVIIGEIK